MLVWEEVQRERKKQRGREREKERGESHMLPHVEKMVDKTDEMPFRVPLRWTNMIKCPLFIINTISISRL